MTKRYLFFGMVSLGMLMHSLATTAQHQNATADTITLASKILNEDRKIYIHYPASSKTNPSNSYPVLYVLDADNHFSMLSIYCDYLSRWDVNSMPEMIVVGITNTNRVRDLTPSHTDIDYFGKRDTVATSWLKTSGGNDNFFKFIREELMPYVNAHYKTKPFTIFAGHSFGGITTINCLLTQPNMFNAYVAVSPSFWWDRKYVLHLADKQLIKGAPLPKILFCSDGNEGLGDNPAFHTDLLEFDSLIKRKTPEKLSYSYVHYPEETHMTEPIKAYYDALRFIFKGWSLPPTKDQYVNSTLIKNHYSRLSERFGFTILPDEKNTIDWAQYLVRDNGTIDNAISLYEMIAEMYPSSHKTFSDLGDAYLKKGDKQKAKLNYQKALSLHPADEGSKRKLKDMK